VTVPRFGTDYFVGSFAQTKPKLASLTLDSRFSKDVEQALAAKGHVVTRQKAPLWAPQQCSSLIRNPDSLPV